MITIPLIIVIFTLPVRDAIKPSIGIYSLGYDNSSAIAAYVPQFNDYNAVIGCNIYDYFNAANSVGLELNLGNTSWTIAANSFFQNGSDHGYYSQFVPPCYMAGAFPNFFSRGNW